MPERRSPLRTVLAVIAWLLGAAIAYGALTTIAPDALTPPLAETGTSTAFPYAQVIDFPVLLGGGLALVGLVFLFVGIWRLRAGGTAAALVAGLACLVAGGVHLYRGFDAGLASPPRVAAEEVSPQPATPPEGDAAPEEETAPASPLSELTIAQLNVADDTEVHDALVRDLVRAQPDVIVIAEAGPGYGQALADRLAAREAGTFTVNESTASLVVLTSADTTTLAPAPVRSLDTATNRTRITQGGSLVLTDGAGTTIYAAAVAPRDRADMRPYQLDISGLAGACEHNNLIIAGDLRASMNAGPLARSGCTDVATELGYGGFGTWPAGAPGWLGASRSHVLLGPAPPQGAWKPEHIAYFNIPRSNHRGLVVTLTR